MAGGVLSEGPKERERSEENKGNGSSIREEAGHPEKNGNGSADAII